MYYCKQSVLPNLSIIIPSYNQGDYIEETILSVINQDYPNKELIIIDGGSTDNSVEIIKKYEKNIAYWVSEKDNGQADAINKGFWKASGDFIAWMNSDDVYYAHAFNKIFSHDKALKADFIFGAVKIGADSTAGMYIGKNKKKKIDIYNLLHFFYLVDYIIPSQSVFVKKSFLDKHGIGFLNNNCHYCMDMEWYCRISLVNPVVFEYEDALSFFRINDTTKTGSQYNKMQAEAIQIFLNYRKYLTDKQQKRIFEIVFFHRVLRKLFEKKIKVRYSALFKLLYKAPVPALLDRRFLGLVKNKLLTNR